ncbi:MAG: class I SAM-dependent methyltransferase [Candidatus Methanomethylicaceae archaeon]
MNMRDFITLIKLAKNRLRSEEDYKRLQAFQAHLLLEYMQRFGVNIEDQIILDLGSGLGGYSQEFAKRGAKAVISLDLVRPLCSLGQGVHHLIADALSIPLRDESVDFIFCASLIEHVNNPLLLLTEINRILKTEHYCYLSFPPFYSPRGGHEFSPFHYLGERYAIALTSFWRKYPEWINKIYMPNPAPRSFSETWQGWGLFKMTISRAKQLICQSDFKIIDISTRYLPINTARLPLIGEILTWHVQFILLKPKR